MAARQPVTYRNGLKRSPIQRKPRAVDPTAFDIVTQDGDRYPWPASWMSEADWQETVIDYAKFGDRDLKWWHCLDSRKNRRGWFDLVLLQPNRGVAILTELKVRDRQGNTKQASAEQKEFIAAALACNLDVRLWLYPDDQRDAWITLTGRPWQERSGGLHLSVPASERRVVT